MATTIITGRDLVLSIDSDSYDAQASSVVMALVNETNELDVLDGTVYKTVKTTGTLTVDMYQDWGVAGSLCEALWNAAKNAPDTGLPFSFTANTGSVFAGNVLPAFPDAGGAAPGELSSSLTLTIVGGAVTLT